MSEAALHELAAAAGVQVDWVDAGGRRRRVQPPSLRAVLAALGLPATHAGACRDSLRQLREGREPPPLLTVRTGAKRALGRPGERYRLLDEHGAATHGVLDDQGRLAAPAAHGYFALEQGGRMRTLAVAPVRCFGVADAIAHPHPRAWGVALQVYSARSELDAGIGDAAGAADWVRRVAAAGGDALALSPVHAALPAGAGYSPYSPADRRFLDPLHAAPAQVLGAEAAQAALRRAGLEDGLAGLHGQALIDWPVAAEAKWRWLRQLHAGVRDGQRPPALDAFARQGGAALARHAHWAAAAFGDHDPDLHVFAQWLAADSWSGLQAQARRAGLGIGLVADLAVGFDPAGSEAAAWPQAVMHGLTLGAPADAFNADGQGWGIAGYSPHGLRAGGYAPFLALLRAVMHGRGGVRIDHILGLQRLWVLPEGASAAEGAYLDYPLHELLDLLALESWRQRAIVIGEDLGVVPPRIRAELARRGVLGIDVLMFTRDRSGAFLAPAQWRRQAVATTTTHDLPTLQGWRQGRDLQWRRRLELCDDAQQRSAWRQRQRDSAALDAAATAALAADAGAADARLQALRFVASGPSPLALLPAEDALALDEQPNLPGTVGGHPNWRRRLPEPLPEATLRQSLQAFAQARQAQVDA
ncbi:4-alpha-glucanotransferase [Stenotrophomonas sp. MMGLT7]|uniref:4-alpha-glucanotransferase n=1 Tax=Stenotrophomonas sp. MMGLT7 TaxID=2901227 RepID=UPI001E2B4583|nr:4-alpha-glucanotransferase [Stenotrophomonas sp. MMGLT7]MCD7098044.1 4-alpha-glucanotransferase [Stenotrophomonas sp. MMGLT7]